MWGYCSPVHIVCGTGCRHQLASLLKPYTSLLLVTSPGMVQRGTAQNLQDAAPGHAWHVLPVAPEPTIDGLDATIATVQGYDTKIDAVVALGGGSVMDSGKALALTLRGDVRQPLHRILRQGLAYASFTPLPLFCLPTTAGTGAEVTPFATIWDKKEGRKYSLSNVCLFPGTALIDPELTCSLPTTVTLYSALDALSHALETLWNMTATPVSNALAVHALRCWLQGMHGTLSPQMSLERREHLQEAALLAGMAISQSQTSLAHAISYPLTMRCGMPHGLACAVFLPKLMDLVTEHHAWNVYLGEANLGSIRAILEECHLQKALLDYRVRDIAYDVSNEILHYNRSQTFAVPVDEDFLRKLLLCHE